MYQDGLRGRRMSVRHVAWDAIAPLAGTRQRMKIRWWRVTGVVGWDGGWVFASFSLTLSYVSGLSRLLMCLVLALLFNVFSLSAWKFRKINRDHSPCKIISLNE